MSNIYKIIGNKKNFVEENELSEAIRNYDPDKDPNKVQWGKLMDRVDKIQNYNQKNAYIWRKIDKACSDIEKGLPVIVEERVEQLFLFA